LPLFMAKTGNQREGDRPGHGPSARRSAAR
jgi:hypothetical protein